MTRAEQRALEAYPRTNQVQYYHREGFVLGYEQAEKDTLEMAVNWLQSRLNKQGFLDYDDIFDLRSLIVEL